MASDFYLRLPKIVVSSACAFLPKKRWRKKLRNALAPQNTYTHSEVHGKIYFPCYNSSVPYPSPQQPPQIYNAQGKKLELFFLRDEHMNSYGTSQHFLWDRFNVGLDTHFYTHTAMTQLMGSPSRRFGMLIESEAIEPQGYELLLKSPNGLAKEFSKIFTFSEKILDKIGNATFMPAGEVWYGRDGLSEMDKQLHERKNKLVSILSSRKNDTLLHQLRVAIAKKCERLNLADTFGNFNGGPRLDTVAHALKDYRYTIAVENYSASYYFTEKILNCFASMTVPIYIGATKIGEFFNPDGIIQIPPEEVSSLELDGGLERILKRISEQDYQDRLPAIIDNYERVQQFLDPLDYIYEKHLVR